MNMPKGIEKVTMLEKENPPCKMCLKRDRREVKLFRLEFVTELVNECMAELLNEHDNTSGVFCLNKNCDKGY